jgi:pyroglutamyl-peptidase
MKKYLSACVFVCLALVATQVFADDEVDKVLLAIGFEPFGGDKTNGSWEAVKYLNGKRFMDTKVVTAQLPVIWDKAAIQLQELIRQYKPTAVVCFGQAESDWVRLETTARNERAKIPDNDGVIPENMYIYSEAPPTLETGLPLAEIEGNLRLANIPVKISPTAGTYLCNDTFYNLMFNPGTEDAKTMMRGFVHVPQIKTKIVSFESKQRYFTKSVLHKAAEIIVKTVIAVNNRKLSAKLNSEPQITHRSTGS